MLAFVVIVKAICHGLPVHPQLNEMIWVYNCKCVIKKMKTMFFLLFKIYTWAVEFN